MSLPNFPDELKEKQVFVTGATQGAGFAIATRFAEAGARVLVCARKDPPAGQPFEFIRGDLSSLAGVVAVAKELQKRISHLDILVHNVGGSSAPTGGFQAATDEIVHISSIQRKLPKRHPGELRVAGWYSNRGCKSAD